MTSNGSVPSLHCAFTWRLQTILVYRQLHRQLSVCKKPMSSQKCFTAIATPNLIKNSVSSTCFPMMHTRARARAHTHTHTHTRNAHGLERFSYFSFSFSSRTCRNSRCMRAKCHVGQGASVLAHGVCVCVCLCM